MRVMKNNRRVIFFDVIIGAMILMIGFKIMFPNALGGSASVPSDDSGDQTVSLVHLDTLDELGVVPLLFNERNGDYPALDRAYSILSDSSSLFICFDYDIEESAVEVQGIPFCYVGDTIYYFYHAAFDEPEDVYPSVITDVVGDYQYWVFDCAYDFTFLDNRNREVKQ